MRKAVSCMLVLFMVLTLVGCDGKNHSYSLYFAAGDYRSLAEESVHIDETMTDEALGRFLIEKLLEGPAKGKHRRLIPEDTKLIHMTYSKNVAFVNFSQEFDQTQDHAQRLLAIYSVVNTLQSALKGAKVHLAVNGRVLQQNAAENKGTLSMDSVITDDEIGRHQTAVIVLYFADRAKSGLLSEARTVDVKDNETVEKTAIVELLKGSAQGNARTIPSDVKLLNVETKDKICYVSFSKEFLNISEADMPLAVYAVVNTVTRLHQADKVQFLIEGVKTMAAGGLSLADPFEYNARIIRTADE